jgi:hypothetical protein
MAPQVTAAWIAASAAVLTLIGTLAAQIYGRRATSRELERTLAEQRTRTLNERFATAAGQLGDDKPSAVRLAGVYAMAGLADDWAENRQTCVDVLCAFLRLPYDPDPGEDAAPAARAAYLAKREVRHTVIRVIAAHLKDGAAASWQGRRHGPLHRRQVLPRHDGATASWQGLNFDFTGVVFDGGDFTGARFSGGTVRFTGARFSRGTVDFHFAVFSGGTVDFSGAQFSGGKVGFDISEFSGSRVDFSDARFSGGTVDFFHAKFSGGEVDFSSADVWSSPPVFPWGDTDTPPPWVKLPKKDGQSQT